jgi:hypothetical protein
MVAQHVIGKATRDALFLSHFPVSRLPLMLIVGSVVSAAVVYGTTRIIGRFGPARVAPIAFAAHGLVVLVEWALSSHFEAQIALVFYVQTVAMGPPLISAFWSVVSEGFDPHTAKKVIGRIGAGAALGGIVGGAIAWGASKVTTVPTMLGVIAISSAVCAWSISALARGTKSAAPPARTAVPSSGLGALRRTPYLRLLALIVLLGASTQGLLDYALGAEASATYGRGAHLLAFFAIFQTVIGTLSFVLQLAANRFALERLGVGGTMALLPAAVAALGAMVVGMPTLATVAIQRGAEGVLRASLFRSAYEVLYTPVAQASKRPAKILIDVGFDRTGALIGSALTLGLAALLPHQAVRAVTVAAMVAAGIQVLVAFALHRGYVAELTNRLRAGTLVLDPGSVVDATTRDTLSRTMRSLDRPTLLAEIAAFRAGTATPEAPVSEPIPEYPELEPGPSDAVVSALVDLRSPDAATVIAALRSDESVVLSLAIPVLDLLARDDVAAEAALALVPLAPRLVGTIVDVVLDSRRPLATRRRAARLLATVSSQRAATGLDSGLDDDQLDVRYSCGRVLLGMRVKSSELRFDAATAFARARRELASPWSNADRGAREIEHAFNVVSLTLPHEPIQLAYGAVLARDPFLRGVALEYLDTVLPADLRASLATRLERQPPAKAGEADASSATKRQRSTDSTALHDLLLSRDAIRVSIEDLRRLQDPEGNTGA